MIFSPSDLSRARRMLFVLGASLGALTLPSESVFAQKKQLKDSTRSERLKEVVVSASGFEQDKKDAPASITVISRKEIESQRNNSLAEVLSNVEGVDVGGTFGKTGNMTIMMRGMPAEYTLVLVDGRRQTSAGNITPNGFGETSSGFLPSVEDIERIEVIRGPMATLYGSDAMGGVVNIITRKIARRWGGSVSSDQTFQENSDFGRTNSSNFAFSGPLLSNKLGLSLRGRAFNRQASRLEPTGEFDSSVTISRRGASPVKAMTYAIGGRLSYAPARAHRIWADYDVSKQVYDNTSAQLGTLDNPANPRGGYGPKQWFNRDQVSVSHSWRFGSSHLETGVTRNMTETIGRTIPPNTPGGPPGSGAPPMVAGSPRRLESTNTMGDIKLTSAFNKHVVTVGGQFWNVKMIDGVALDNFKQDLWSGFLEDEWRFIPSLALTVGVRHDQHDKFGGHTSPRAYLVWSANPFLTVKGGVSRGYRAPRVDELADGINGFTGQGSTATIGSPHLKPETSTATELGLHFRTDSRWGASLTVFNNDFKDKIASGPGIPNCSFSGYAGNPPADCQDYGDFPTQELFGQKVNIDKAVTQGGEASLRIPVTSIALLSTNYTFTKSEQKSGANKGAALVNTPKHMANARLSTSTNSMFDGWVSGEYRGSRLRRTNLSNNEAYNALGDYKAYSVFHIGGTFRVLENMSINATIYNLANKDFLKFAEYASPTASDPDAVAYTSLYNIHEEGRRLWLSTTIRF